MLTVELWLDRCVTGLASSTALCPPNQLGALNNELSLQFYKLLTDMLRDIYLYIFCKTNQSLIKFKVCLNVTFSCVVFTEGTVTTADMTHSLANYSRNKELHVSFTVSYLNCKRIFAIIYCKPAMLS